MPMAAWGKGLEYLRGREIMTADGPLSQGTVGTVFRTGMCNVCNDIAEDSRMEPWQEMARQLGFCASASFPIKLGGTTIAALVLGAGEADYFKEDEIQLMSAVAGHLSFTLQTLQKEEQRLLAESALRESEGRFRGMFVAAATGLRGR